MISATAAKTTGSTSHAGGPCSRTLVKKTRSEELRSMVTGTVRTVIANSPSATGKYSGARSVRRTRRKPRLIPRKEPSSTTLEK